MSTRTNAAALLVIGSILGCDPAPSPGASATTSSEPRSPIPSASVAPASSATVSSPSQSSAAAPGVWSRAEFEIGVPLEPSDLWAVDDHFVVVGRRDTGEEWPGWLALWSRDGSAWDVAEVPTQIRELYAGVVFDGRLWFIARVAGTPTDSRQLVSTTTGSDWEFLGPARNLGARNGANFLARAGGRWVAAVYRSTPGEPFPTTETDVRVSADGISWTIADVPHAGERTRYYDARALDSSIVVRGTREVGEDVQAFFMSSGDGLDWRSEDFRPERFAFMRDYVCTDTGCVGVGAGVGDLENDTDAPRAWTSRDGLHWIPATVEMPPGRVNANMDEVHVAGSGFLAQGGPGGDAWLSTDGTAWRHVQAMPKGEVNLYGVAVIGDLILGYQTDGRGLGLVEVWTGTLAATGD